MAAHFNPLWVSILYESIQEWINRYTSLGYIFFPREPHFLGNDSHKIVCAKSQIIYNVEIMKDNIQPRVMGKKDFEEKVTTAILMVRMTNPVWGTGKVVVMDRRFCVLEVFVSMVYKGVLG